MVVNCGIYGTAILLMFVLPGEKHYYVQFANTHSFFSV